MSAPPLRGAEEASAGWRAAEGAPAPDERGGPCAGRLPTPPEPRGRSRRCAHFAGGTRRLRKVRGRGRERRTRPGRLRPAAQRPEIGPFPAGLRLQAGNRGGGKVCSWPWRQCPLLLPPFAAVWAWNLRLELVQAALCERHPRADSQGGGRAPSLLSPGSQLSDLS